MSHCQLARRGLCFCLRNAGRAAALAQRVLDPDPFAPTPTGDAAHAASYGLSWLAYGLAEDAPTLLVVGVITYLLVYAIAMIRDIDNPFEYHNGKPGAADVDLGVLEACERRLRGLAAAMGGDRDVEERSATTLTP